MCILYVSIMGEVMRRRQIMINDIADTFFGVPVDSIGETTLMTAMSRIQRITDDEFDYFLDYHPLNLIKYLFIKTS